MSTLPNTAYTGRLVGPPKSRIQAKGWFRFLSLVLTSRRWIKEVLPFDHLEQRLSAIPPVKSVTEGIFCAYSPHSRISGYGIGLTKAPWWLNVERCCRWPSRLSSAILPRASIAVIVHLPYGFRYIQPCVQP